MDDISQEHTVPFQTAQGLKNWLIQPLFLPETQQSLLFLNSWWGRSLEFCQFQGLPEAILSCLLPVLPRFWSSVCLSFLTWGMLVWVSSGVVSVTQHLATPEATMQEFFISIYWLQTHMLNLLSLTLQPLSVNTLSPNIVPRRFLWLSCLLCWPLTQKSCLFLFLASFFKHELSHCLPFCFSLKC